MKNENTIVKYLRSETDEAKENYLLYNLQPGDLIKYNIKDYYVNLQLSHYTSKSRRSGIRYEEAKTVIKKYHSAGVLLKKTIIRDIKEEDRFFLTSIRYDIKWCTGETQHNVLASYWVNAGQHEKEEYLREKLGIYPPSEKDSDEVKEEYYDIRYFRLSSLFEKLTEENVVEYQQSYNDYINKVRVKRKELFELYRKR